MIRLRTGNWVFALSAVLLGVWLWPPWSTHPRVDLVYEGVKPILSGRRTNYYAIFRIRNPGSATIYYEGTPQPVYIIEQKSAQAWDSDEALPDPEVLHPIFPGKNFQFSIPVPETSNTWRVAVSVVKPSRAPLLLRRFFKPRHLVCRSPAITARAPGSGAASESEVNFSSNSAVR